MTFQFLCPQGHLLEGEESHSGLQCQCPQCGVLFIIPSAQADAEGTEPVTAAADSAREPAAKQKAGAEDLLDEEGGGGGTLGDNLAAEVVHIPCPNGHELETPIEWLGIEALCPYCRVQFRLRNEDSIEYQQRQAILDAKRAKFWFKWSIVAAVVVGLLLIVLMIIAAVT